MKGIEIARACHVSTSTLKHYEEWGLVPEVKRAANGYRQYSVLHFAYFKCIVNLNIGFGMKLVREFMPLVQAGEIVKGLWLINEQHARLQEDRAAAEHIVQLLDLDEVEWFSKSRTKKSCYKIGEVAGIARVATSAIRHWEKEELISPLRDQESGYRYYTPEDIKRILIIRTVSKAAWSLAVVREVLAETENNHFKRAKELAQKTLHYIDESLVARAKAMPAVNELLSLVTTEDSLWQIPQLGSYGYYR
ncbi:DNA-binding transcriptional regulator, MerR family [Amphibacillus marinus]|uniref:DNA-binding transcriptional regulator, MerR family n=1 Tax=Amphibacillus marinus TaxID=872970 RepID=A0A1H8QSD2_9BACI|nr:MerR family transcriptional regulator [Amphibacillus marinus]SEO57122.1 DNA-binding transcriptional regulator, MerR family [Amphibacillus marinus]